MNWKRHFVEAATLIIAAVVCALVANAVASSERKVTVVPTFAAPPPSARQPSATPPPTTTTVVPTTSGGGQPTPAVQPQPKIAPKTDSGRPLPSTGTTPKPQSIADFKSHPDKPYIEIGYNDVAALHQAGALFLDARRTSAYQQGHIAGARPFSVWESDIDDKVNKLFAERSDPRDQEKPIVAYCSGGDCEDSHMLAQKLWGAQFNNVYVYKDGFPDWEKRGGAVHTGATP